MATLEEQIELEHRMVQSGIDRYNKELKALSDKSLESKTKHGRSIVANICEPVADELRLELQRAEKSRNNKVKLLQGCDTRQVAYLSLITLVDTISKGLPLLATASNIGKQIETQFRLDQWMREDRNTASNLIKMANKKSDKGFDHKRHGLNHKMKLDGLDIQLWTNSERINIGVRMIDIVIRTTGIVYIKKEHFKRKTTSYIYATEETLDWVKGFNTTHETNLPRYSPCIIEPKDWDSFRGGGYHSTHVNKKPFLRVHGL